jgi:prevent-host-death family protein
MGEVSVRVLNQETSKVLARVKSGEEVTLTERGDVIARIVPAMADPLAAYAGAGRVRLATTQGAAPRPTIAGHTGDPDAGALLERLRSDERY